ncbi:MAG: hypothetical protein MJK12_08850 [Colwellia sp.]|nr:hypothetical protein [Colwellia sp.]
MLRLFLLLLVNVVFVIPMSLAQQVKVEVIDPNAIGVEHMVVYLEPVNKPQNVVINSKPLLVEKHVVGQTVIAQKDKAFIPYITVTQKGQQLSFQNQDDITHHIYSVSGKNRFSFKIKAGKEKSSPVLEHTGEVAMGCNIHDWMSGFVLVVDTPYYAQTDDNGIATLDLATGGEYQLVVWHPQLPTKNYQIAQLITVSNNDEDNEWKIKLPVHLLAIPEQENQDEFDFLEGY